MIDRNVYENLEFVLKATGWKNKKAIRERIETVLTKVGMSDKQAKMPHQLSGGEQQRIVLARACLLYTSLQQIARQFAADYKALFGVLPEIAEGKPCKGDFFFTIKRDKKLEKEGYEDVYKRQLIW